MFNLTVRSLFCLAGVLWLTTGIPLVSQDTGLNLQQIQTESLNQLQEGDFRSALQGFRKLMDAQPDDAMLSYHVGICLVELNEDLQDAIELLYGASVQNVPKDVYYYLGKAYHRNYNFTDARKYYSRFEMEASRQELKEYNPSHLIETTKSAAEITAMYNPYDVMNVTFIDLYDSLQFSQIKMKGGVLQRKPPAYFHPDEDHKGLTSLIFDPQNAVRGDYMYYSGYGRNRKGGAQLFRVKKGTGKSWGDPEEMKTLSSDGDEILPYFDPIENDLYFASNGRQGIGGFDLFRTHYDSQRDQWSEPVNLGFPVNSAMDEYLLLPGSDLGMVMFFSNREGTDSTVTVYRVHLAEPKKRTLPNDHRKLKEIALLDGVAAEILAEIEKVKQKEMEAELASAAQHSVPPAITEVRVLSEERIMSDYKYSLMQALKHQVNSDSLKNLVSNARFLIEDSDDPNDRWVWQKQIMLWEKKARDEESMAKEMFVKMEDDRAVLNKISSGRVPDAIEIDTVIGDLTLYRYTAKGFTPSHLSPSAERTEIQKIHSTPPIVSEKNDANDSYNSNAFEILDYSPYNANNPIPMDVPMPYGVYYMIQVGVVGSQVAPDAFGGLSPITGIHLKEQGKWKYFAGNFTHYVDAIAALPKIKEQGFADAFIVAWLNGEIISIQEAKEIE